MQFRDSELKNALTPMGQMARRSRKKETYTTEATLGTDGDLRLGKTLDLLRLTRGFGSQLGKRENLLSRSAARETYNLLEQVMVCSLAEVWRFEHKVGENTSRAEC